MIAYYENSIGEKLNLLNAPYRIVDTDVFDSSWEESDSGFEKKVDIDVFGNKSEFAENMEYLYNMIAVDPEKGVYGKLYVNGTYLRCNVQASKKSGWKGFVYSEVELTFFAPLLEWVQEIRKSFYPHSSEEDVDGLNFPFNFPFNFTKEVRGVESWKIDHVVASDFQMIVYGPCSQPKIFINGYPYEVNTELLANEYLVIDSRNYTITKYNADGTTSNLFHERGYEYSVFEKIPSGTLTISWPEEFGFDLILYAIRREPRW